MLEPSSSTDVQAQIAQLETLLSERTAELEAHKQRIRLLEEALRVMRADKYGASREKLGQAPGQRGLFNEAEATLEVTEAAGVEPTLTATPLREVKASATSPGRKALDELELVGCELAVSGPGLGGGGDGSGSRAPVHHPDLAIGIDMARS